MNMKPKKILKKKLSRTEKKNSFSLVSPATGTLMPLSYSNDLIVRMGNLGIGFVINDFTDDTISSPINGYFEGSLDMSTGIVILDRKQKVYVVLKLTGGNEYVKNQMMEVLVQPTYSEIKRGQNVLRIDREYLGERGYKFQLSVTFMRYDKSDLDAKYDILYDFSHEDGIITKNEHIGKIYQVDFNKVLDVR